MQATVVKLNLHLPTAEAKTDNGILVAFRPPLDGSVALSHRLEIDLVDVDIEKDVINLTTSKTLRLRIEKQNIHDLALPSGHGTSRFPSIERRTGG